MVVGVQVTIDAFLPDGQPMAGRAATITPMLGDAGAALDATVVLGGQTVVALDDDGHAEVALEPTTVDGDPIIWRIEVDGDVTRHLDLSEATSPVSWANPAVLVLEGPAPTDWVPVQPDLSSATPEALGTAAAGVDTEAARSDHVHPMPSASDVGAAPSTRTITAGTGLTGGGDLSANRTLAVAYGTGAGTAAQGNDSRLSDARTPTAHAASHAVGGGDPLDADAIAYVDTYEVGATTVQGGLDAVAYVGIETQEALAVVGFPNWVDLPETVDATNPAAGVQRLVARTGGLYVRDEAGTEVGPLGAGGGGGGIPETLIDAAGDLIVGTAADTAARLAVGTSGQVLTSNGTTAAWAPPPMASIGYVSGALYGVGGNSGSVNYHPANTTGRWVAHPAWLPAGNYTGLSVLSTVAAVSTWRLGIYNGTPDGATTLLHDCGTIDMNASPGSLLASSAFTVPTTGLYWLALLVDALTAVPTVVSFRGTAADIPALPYLGHRFATTTSTRVYFARYASGVTTGAMPATAPTQSPTDQACIIRAHAA